MAKTIKRAVGDLGEGIACIYLQNKGFTVVERNYLIPWGEIDIIAQKDNKLHFVEVKSVTREAGRGDGSRVTFRPEENMHPAKIRRLHRAIQTYLLQRKVPEDVSWQIDLSCVYIYVVEKKAKVEMLENIIL